MGKAMFAVLDLESTGLESQYDVPLELGIVLIDGDNNEVAAWSRLVWESSPGFQHGVNRGRANHFVNKMHTENGLWSDVIDKGHSRRAVDREACAFLADNGVGPQSREDDFDGIGMMGNSTGSLDRPFVMQHFPLLNAYLGYRNIDMSSIKEIVKRRHPALYENLKPIIGTKADAPHRVLGDARACIREFQAYCDEFLIMPDA